MSETLIHFPLYIGDTLKRFIEYPTLQERGAWISIVVALVQNNGVLTDDDTIYYKCLAFNEQDKQVLQQVLSKCLSKTEKGWVDATTSLLINNQKILREKRRLAGQAGGKSKQFKLASATANATILLKQSESESEPESEPELKTELKEQREALSIFKNKVLNEEMKKFAEEKGVFGKQLETSWQRFLIKKGNAMIERKCSYEQFFAEWQLWILNEKKPPDIESTQSELSPADKTIQRLSTTKWKLHAMKSNTSLKPSNDDVNFYNQWVKENGEVWWENIQQFKKGN